MEKDEFFLVIIICTQKKKKRKKKPTERKTFHPKKNSPRFSAARIAV